WTRESNWPVFAMKCKDGDTATAGVPATVLMVDIVAVGVLLNGASKSMMLANAVMNVVGRIVGLLSRDGRWLSA
ncbi:hypothetical protein, partial [uncultured Chloroflexus sp.]|uniref:hypothetical protein n=1 Tax=uncultured Chloroflexus sp. TaxID=214040 RepID=UPI00263412FD